MPEVQDIFAAYADEYRQSHVLPLIQHKAINAIVNCRTSRLGGHMDACSECGYQKPSYNSCRNRHCPKCQTFSKERWIDAQKANLLNVGYFHVVFTVPHELHTIIYNNQRDCYNLLFRCVAETLHELAGNPKYLGAQIGFTSVLHTWEQNLCFHPHVHCIVPAGGLTALGKWQPSRKKFFIPVRVLSRKFRGKFLALLKLRFPQADQRILNQCYGKEWVVHWRQMTLSADEFIRRFLLYVLPRGFMKIRHYGFLSSRGKQKWLNTCKIGTGTSLFPQQKLSAEQLIEKLIGRKPSQCPRCGCTTLLKTGLSPPAA